MKNFNNKRNIIKLKSVSLDDEMIALTQQEQKYAKNEFTSQARLSQLPEISRQSVLSR